MPTYRKPASWVKDHYSPFLCTLQQMVNQQHAATKGAEFFLKLDQIGGQPTVLDFIERFSYGAPEHASFVPNRAMEEMPEQAKEVFQQMLQQDLKKKLPRASISEKQIWRRMMLKISAGSFVGTFFCGGASGLIGAEDPNVIKASMVVGGIAGSLVGLRWAQNDIKELFDLVAANHPSAEKTDPKSTEFLGLLITNISTAYEDAIKAQSMPAQL